MAVLIEYTGFRENVEFRIKYLKRKKFVLKGHGSVFALDDDDNHARLVAENPGAFRYTNAVEECDICGKAFAPGRPMFNHRMHAHPDRKIPEGPMTRQNKTKWYKKRLSEIKMPDHRRRR